MIFLYGIYYYISVCRTGPTRAIMIVDNTSNIMSHYFVTITITVKNNSNSDDDVDDNEYRAGFIISRTTYFYYSPTEIAPLLSPLLQI